MRYLIENGLLYVDRHDMAEKKTKEDGEGHIK